MLVLSTDNNPGSASWTSIAVGGTVTWQPGGTDDPTADIYTEWADALAAASALTEDGTALANIQVDTSFGAAIIPRLEWVDVARGVVAVVLTSLLASLWPAVHAATLEPVEALRS